jgi:hypothetical protein
MPRENAVTKGLRYLSEARLQILRVDGRVIAATCRGDGGEVYQLGYERARWWCSCPARGMRCAHLTALMRVVAVPTIREAAS